jgi:uncharacterized membrane protein YqgA involved in biofilm formation
LTGTIINMITVLIGGSLGILFGARLPERVRQTVVAGLGLFTLAIGLQMALEMQQPLAVLGGLLIGGILGEWWRIEEKLSNFGAWLEHRFAGGARSKISPDNGPMDRGYALLPVESSRFIQGFLTASLLFCIGPMTILGAIQDGLSGDYNLLAVKAIMDGFAALAFASTLGIGVLFSVIVIFLYQGGISLLAAQAQAFITPTMMNEMTATGGILLLGLAISSLLEIKKIRVGNFLPALLFAPLIIAILSAFGIL